MLNKNGSFTKAILSVLVLVTFLLIFTGCKEKEQIEKITVINGAVPVYLFTIPKDDSLGNYTKLTAQFLVDNVNYREQARIRAYGVYPAEYFEDLGNIIFLDFGQGNTDKNGPYLLSNVLGQNRNLSIISNNAGAHNWFTIEFPLNGLQHPAYNYANFPASSTNGDLYFALGLGTGNTTKDFTYYVKDVTMQNDNGSKKIVSKGSGFNKPAFVGYPANIDEIHRRSVKRAETNVVISKFDDPSGYYQVRKIYPWLYSIYDPDSVYCYLFVGEERALLYDTVYGIGSLPAVIKNITDKPVTVVVSHGHGDHVNGAYQFDEVWMHEADFSMAYSATSENSRRRMLEGLIESKQILPEGFDSDVFINAGPGNLLKIEPGFVFDLGGLNIEIINMEGHTAGSIGVLARETRVLLTSDAASFHTWMFLPESLPMSRYIAMLERTILLDFDTFFSGHSDAPMSKGDYGKILNVARNATMEKALPYSHAYFSFLNPVVYQEDNVAVIFSEEKLR